MNSYALSCMDPESMVEQYVKDGYTIVTAKPTENKEHVREKADKQDPNAMYDSGYTAQYLEIKTSHNGTSPDKRWAYFERNGTWNYLCAGEPPKLGTENIYVLREPQTSFDVVGVAGVYPVNSDIAKAILAELKAADMEAGEVYKTDKTYWVTQLHDQLKDMAFMMKVKLAEWTFWKGASK